MDYLPKAAELTNQAMNILQAVADNMSENDTEAHRENIAALRRARLVLDVYGIQALEEALVKEADA